jgi:hypothetical protein
MPKDPSADRVWEFIEKIPDARGALGNNLLKCKLCKVTFRGSLTRAREHLAGAGGNVMSCQEVEATHPSLRPLLLAEIAAKKDNKEQQLKRTADQKQLEANAAKRRAESASSGNSWTRRVGWVGQVAVQAAGS